MNIITKTIRLSQHAKEQCRYRGTNEEEISLAIRSSTWGKAELNRLECRKDFVFGKEWNGKYFKTKQVRPIFIEEENEIFVVTVYVYYF